MPWGVNISRDRYFWSLDFTVKTCVVKIPVITLAGLTVINLPARQLN
jgi:hypothetical protein